MFLMKRAVEANIEGLAGEALKIKQKISLCTKSLFLSTKHGIMYTRELIIHETKDYTG